MCEAKEKKETNKETKWRFSWRQPSDIQWRMALHWLVMACLTVRYRGEQDSDMQQVSRRAIIRLELDKGHNVVREGETRTIESLDGALHAERKLEHDKSVEAACAHLTG